MLSLSKAPTFIADIIYEYDESPTHGYVDGVWSEREYLPYMEFYRYKDSSNSIILLKYKVVRETESSFLIADYNKDRWIRKGAGSSFCNVTKPQAWSSFIYRKKKQLEHLTRQKNNVEAILGKINESKRDGDTLVPR